MEPKPTKDCDARPAVLNPQVLSCVQKVMVVERSLSNCLKRHRPMSSSLLTPSTRSEVDTILALARTFSNRTSAPQNWNPSLPVLHFSTPNPLPHQLRSGLLAAMQLKMSRSLQRRKRLKHTEDIKGKEKDATINAEASKKDTINDPKRERVHKNNVTQSVKTVMPSSQKNAITMNLSDSSEDDYYEDEDEDEDDDSSESP